MSSSSALNFSTASASATSAALNSSTSGGAGSGGRRRASAAATAAMMDTAAANPDHKSAAAGSTERDLSELNLSLGGLGGGGAGHAFPLGGMLGRMPRWIPPDMTELLKNFEQKIKYELCCARLCLHHFTSFCDDG
jgi:hypothetical protein